MKKILVLLSTYNGEKYLMELMDSLSSQKNVSMDILIRDDGSKDKTIELLKKLESDNVKCIYGKNLGPGNSFFELIKEASLDYDYYALCDQDDVWLDNKLSVAVSKLLNFDQSKPALYYSGQILTDIDLNILREHSLDVKRSEKSCCIFNQMAGCTCVFNNFLLRYLKMHIPSDIYAHDAWCYRLCVALDGNIYVDTNSYILYRQHGNNAVGINNSFRGKLTRARICIFKYKPSTHATKIVQNYSEYMSDEKISFFKNITIANNDIRARIKLFKDKSIIFNSISMRVLFLAKLFLKKM